MMVVGQNILSSIMLKNYKLSNVYFRLHLSIPEILQARNLSSNSRIIQILLAYFCVLAKMYRNLVTMAKHIFC